MEITKRKNLVGGFITLIAGIAVPVLAIVLLFQNYSSLLKGYVTTGKPAGAIMQDIHQPLFSALLMFAGVLMLVSAVGYFGQKKWAFVYGFTGSVLTLFGGWMMAMFPLMVGLTPYHFSSFFIGAFVFFALLLYVNKVETKIWLTSLLFGMDFVMTFMNGNASLNKMMGGNQLARNMAGAQGVPSPNAPHRAWAKMNVNDALMYELVQQILWVSAFAFFVITIAVIYRKDWVWPVALGASIIAIGAGFPVAIADTLAKESLSSFFFGPILGVVVFFALFIFKDRLWAEGQPVFKKKKQA